jgi:hypothetical protein
LSLASRTRRDFGRGIDQHRRVRRSLVLALVLIAACGPSDEVGDCPTPCVGDDICIGTTCHAAFPRTYTLILGVSLDSRDNDGECWDEPLCGAPDPYVVLRVDGQELGRTDEASDTFGHRWSERPFMVTLRAGSVVELVASDGDVDLDDPAARCIASPITAAALRSGQIDCAPVAGSAVFADVTP